MLYVNSCGMLYVNSCVMLCVDSCGMLCVNSFQPTRTQLAEWVHTLPHSL